MGINRVSGKAKSGGAKLSKVGWGLLVGGLWGCGGTATEATADIPDECIGEYAGTYSGDLRGTLEGSLDAAAVFTATFVQTSTGQSATGSGNIDEDGAISLALGPHQVVGTFNFNRCRATGTWSSGELGGSWTTTKQ